ncbi:pirin family protein [Streptomyces sp. NPDC002133]|uniref:pirin family protein n=1 Tax=Streptomyces sp. NPDC002133 TaxID=3154409 RepID=UPI003318ACB9
MSDVEFTPAAPAAKDAGTSSPGVAEVMHPRMVPLGGPRAHPVRRTLPQRRRSLIGAWCFADHYGPTTIDAARAMDLPGHPHTGLQTVSWLFTGTLEHRDTIGSRALIRAGEMNLMTAGRGIAHAEHTTSDTTTLHGVQLWIALPEHDRFAEPRFESYAPEPVTVGEARMRVFLGSLAGSASPVRTSTPLLGAELEIAPKAVVRLEVDPSFEHGILVDSGDITAGGVAATDAQLLYLPTGAGSLTIETGDRPVRAVLLGGEPLNERIVMWWNFVGRSHEEIVTFRSQWQQQMTGDHYEAGPYGRFPEEWATVLPAPELPNAQLKPRM